MANQTGDRGFNTVHFCETYEVGTHIVDIPTVFILLYTYRME